MVSVECRCFESDLSWLLDCREGGTAPGGGPSLLPRELTIALFPSSRLFTVRDVGDVGTPTRAKMMNVC